MSRSDSVQMEMAKHAVQDQLLAANSRIRDLEAELSASRAREKLGEKAQAKLRSELNHVNGELRQRNDLVIELREELEKLQFRLRDELKRHNESTLKQQQRQKQSAQEDQAKRLETERERQSCAMRRVVLRMRQRELNGVIRGWVAGLEKHRAANGMAKLAELESCTSEQLEAARQQRQQQLMKQVVRRMMHSELNTAVRAMCAEWNHDKLSSAQAATTSMLSAEERLDAARANLDRQDALLAELDSALGSDLQFLLDWAGQFTSDESIRSPPLTGPKLGSPKLSRSSSPKLVQPRWNANPKVDE